MARPQPVGQDGKTNVGLSDPQSGQPRLEAPLGGSCHTHVIVSMILETRRAGFLLVCSQGSDPSPVCGGLHGATSRWSGLCITSCLNLGLALGLVLPVDVVEVNTWPMTNQEPQGVTPQS